MAGKLTYEELEQRVRQLEQVEIDRKRTEEHIRFLSSAVEQSSEGMAIADTEGNLIYVNHAWIEMHGYESSEELAGQNLSIFHNPDQLINEVEPFNSIVMKNGYCKGEVWHIRKDGKPFPTLMTTTLLKDESGNPTAFSGIAKDITDVKKAEEKLKSERDTLQGLMDGLATTRIGVDVVGVDYKVLQQSKLLIDIFGDLTGKLCYENYMGLDIPCDPCPMAVAIKSGKVERAEMLGNDGRHYEIFSAPLPSSDGGIDKAIEVVLDITERKQAEEQRDKLISDLQKALSVVKTLRGFLPICSHCKNIRDDKGYWNQIESYIHKHSDAEFSHGICPECAKKYYPDMDIYDDNGEVTED